MTDIKKWIRRLRHYAPMSLRDWLLSLVVMAVASTICALLRGVSTSDVHVPLIFVLAVLVISLGTEGYFYGILAALTSVITVNYAFTYPYAKLDFSVYGYPLTFLTMLAVGCVVSALTSRVKEQERLRLESEREAVRANLLRAVSHDLRTPLTAISGSLAAVLESGDDALSREAREELLRDAWKDADWLCRMVENLLSVTRIGEDGTSRLNKQEELLEEVVGEAVLNFRKRVPEVEILVSVPEEPLFVPMDALLIEQVLLNLLDNAAVHGQNTSRITVLASRAGSEALLSVEDDGGGIPPERLASLFDGTLPSSRQEGDGHRGMGIGLAVCRTIVQVHGGSIRAENTPEGGARFTFTLPLGGYELEREG